MTRIGEFLPWSLFQLSSSDETALDALSAGSLLLPIDAREVEDLKRGLQEGRRVALSLRTAGDNRYQGLCVFGLERPSPSRDKALALLVFSLDGFSQSGESHRHDTPVESLLGEVQRFARTHGFTRIHCYVPDDSDSVALLTSFGFRTESTPRNNGERVFGMSLHVPASYTGDPYDGKHLLNWLAEQLSIARRDSTDIGVEGFVPLQALNPDLSGTRFGNYALPLRLELTGPRSQTKGNITLRIMLGSESQSNPPISMSAEDLRELTGTPRLDLTLWPPPADGASIVVEVREELFDRFVEQRENAYFDSGSYGTLLERAIASGIPPYIFFVDFETTTSNPRLIGFGRVKSVHRSDPQRLWENWGQISSWSDEESFARYRAIKRKMTVIVFSDLRRVDVVGAGLPVIGHSWTYVPSGQAYQVARTL
jgi:hypothetical protein